MLIGIGYKARSGKNTVGDYLAENYNFMTDAFAFRLRLAIQNVLNIRVYSDEDKSTVYPFWGGRTGREILQQFGTEGLREGFDENIWVKLALYESPDGRHRYSKNDRVIFTDMRFENEAEEIKRLGGIVIRIDRDVAGLSGSTGSHASENGLNDYPDWDYILDNNGTLQDLYDGIDTIMQDLKIVKA